MQNPKLNGLSDYFFRRLAALLEEVEPAADHEPIDLSIGQPMHPTPALLTETLAANGHLWHRYPPVRGTADFREAALDWLVRRYSLEAGMLSADEHILPAAGTKEALFMLAQLVGCEEKAGAKPAVLMPNPFYNVYLGGALLAGADPVLLPVSAATNHLPDLDRLSPDLLARTVAFFLCTPANPQGSAADLAYLTKAIRLARQHDFVLVLDECYSEIYTTAPPTGGLEAAAAIGKGVDNLLACHSLSKRSNAAGLRSGFVVGDPAVIKGFAHLRNYAAAVQPMPVLAAAAALWRDEAHVAENRRLYREKFDLADRLIGDRFDYSRPAGGFFLWLNVGDSEAITKKLWSEAALKVVPGAYIGRVDQQEDWNPGAHAIRVALVHDLATTERALSRLVRTLS